MIRYHSESRRNYLFVLDDEALKFDDNGVKADGGFAWFAKDIQENKDSKHTFKSQAECEKWFNENHQSLQLQSTGLVTKQLDCTTKAAEISDADWTLMVRHMVNPTRFQKKDFHVYEDWLANNTKDRDNDRFPKDMLDNFARTIVGKSKMVGHDRGIGKGIYFKADVRKVTLEEMLSMQFDHPDMAHLPAHLAEVEKRDNGIFWLVTPFYIDATKTELIRDIDSGTTKRSSISFRADKREPIKDADGNVLWYEYQGMGEGIEGSIVWLESQYGAMIKKDANIETQIKALTDEVASLKKAIAITTDGDLQIDGSKPYENEHACRLKAPDQFERFARKNCEQKHKDKCIDVIYGIKEGKSTIQALRYKKDVWAASDAKAHCKSRNGSFEAASKDSDNLHFDEISRPAKKDDASQAAPKCTDLTGGNKVELKFEVKSLDVDMTVGGENPEEIEKSVTEIVEAVTEKADELANTIEEANKSLASVSKVFGDSWNEDALKKYFDGFAEMKNDLVSENVKYLIQNTLLEDEDEKVKSRKELLASLSVAELKARLDEGQKLHNKNHPEKSQLRGNEQEGTQKIESVPVPYESYIAP